MSDALRDRVILISGTTGALGSAATRKFARTEARLVLTGRSEQNLEGLAAEVGRPAERVFTANVILPSIIDTLANRKMIPKADPRKWVPPERIAVTMRFLCSDAAGSIDGVRIPIYGAV